MGEIWIIGGHSTLKKFRVVGMSRDASSPHALVAATGLPSLHNMAISPEEVYW